MGFMSKTDLLNKVTVSIGSRGRCQYLCNGLHIAGRDNGLD
jgi:hypothetical protein